MRLCLLVYAIAALAFTLGWALCALTGRRV